MIKKLSLRFCCLIKLMIFTNCWASVCHCFLLCDVKLLIFLLLPGQLKKLSVGVKKNPNQNKPWPRQSWSELSFNPICLKPFFFFCRARLTSPAPRYSHFYHQCFHSLTSCSTPHAGVVVVVWRMWACLHLLNDQLLCVVGCGVLCACGRTWPWKCAVIVVYGFRIFLLGKKK